MRGNPSFSPDGEQIAFDARPAHPLGEQTAIMVAHVDGTGVRTLSTVPFRQSVHPSWQPLAVKRERGRGGRFRRNRPPRARCILELTGAGRGVEGEGTRGR